MLYFTCICIVFLLYLCATDIISLCRLIVYIIHTTGDLQTECLSETFAETLSSGLQELKYSPCFVANKVILGKREKMFFQPKTRLSARVGKKLQTCFYWSEMCFMLGPNKNHMLNMFE